MAASSVPVVGVVEPGAESASAASKNRKVAVIGTEATISSHAYLKALEARGIQTREQACPLLVPLVEEGWVEQSVTEQIAKIYLDEAFGDGFSIVRCSRSWLHALPAHQVSVEASGSRSGDDHRLGRIDGARGKRFASEQPFCL